MAVQNEGAVSCGKVGALCPEFTLNKAFRSIPGAALRFNLHLKTSAAFLTLFYFFRYIFIALFLNKLNNNKDYRVFEGRLNTKL